MDFMNKKIKEIAVDRSKMRLALKGIDEGIEAAFMKNVNKMTKGELLWSIMPRGTGKRGVVKRKRENKVSGHPQKTELLRLFCGCNPITERQKTMKHMKINDKQ